MQIFLQVKRKSWFYVVLPFFKSLRIIKTPPALARSIPRATRWLLRALSHQQSFLWPKPFSRHLMFTCPINNWLQPFQFSPLIGSQSCVTYHFMSSVHLDFYMSPLMPSGKLKNHLSKLMLMREAWRPARTYRWGQGVLWTPDFTVSRLLGRIATYVAFPQQ